MTTENTVHEGPICLHDIDDPMAWVTTSNGTAKAPKNGKHAIEVAAIWNGTILALRHLNPGQSYTLGSDLPLDESFALDADFQLFGWDEGEAVCRFADSWRGTLRSEELSQSFSDLVEQGTALQDEDEVQQFVLESDQQVVVDVGPLTFVARLVTPGKQVAPHHDGVDAPFVGITSFAAFLAAAFGYIAATAPPAAAYGINELPDRFVELSLETPTPEPALKLPVKPEEIGEREGERSKREEGKRGEETAKRIKAKGEAIDKKRLDRQVAQNAGVLGAISDAGLDDVFGSGSLSLDVSNSVGGLIGVKGNQFGSNGLASRGDGLGGGGKAHGIGGLGNRGRGGGEKDYGLIDGGKRPEGNIGSIGGEQITMGGMDASLVDAVIKRNLARFKYCYQRELTTDPDLGGKVTVKFTIIGDGTVSAALTKASSIGNTSVDSCLNKVMMGLNFPEPKGGGIVLVSYPFVFSPG